MLNKVPTPEMGEAQSSRMTPCIECGKDTPYRTNNRVCCEPCSLKRRRESQRKAAEVQRRKKGIAAVKGTEIICSHCGQFFVRRGRTAKFCLPCRPAANLARRYDLWEKNPALAISSRMANAIGLSLRGNKNGRGWESLVGYTLDDLIRHLERQFLPGMSWSNRSLWHIDHIVPLSSLKFTSTDDPEFKFAWGLPNLQPIWAKDNWQKHAKRTLLL